MKIRFFSVQCSVFLIGLSLCSFTSVYANNADGFLDELDLVVEQGQVDKFEELIHFESLVDDVLLRMKSIPYSTRKALGKGFLSNTKNAAKTLLDSFAGGDVKRLRLQTSGNISKALYRIGFGDQGYSYIEWIIKPNHNSRHLQIVDYYSYTLGKSWSDMIREFFAFSQVGSSNFEELFLVFSGQRNTINEMTKKMTDYLRTKNPEPFLTAYENASEEVRSNDFMVDFYFRVASEVADENQYRRALEVVAKYKSDDPKYAFILMDHYFYLEQFDKAIQALDSFEATLGIEDSAIALLKGNTQSVAGSYEAALSSYSKAKSIEPTLEDIYWGEVNIYVVKEDYKSLVALFAHMESAFGYLFSREDFLSEPYYEGFVQSPEFAAWL
ncbi:hypothetical protein QSV34_14455 [Porticoccus sp. W117]|uniref:tetratricopeptide repeat protein n=1 Tax=Porticoccus sp. W117 TaxID=3054777 RepID=UPI002593B7BA|nr:hypothetical protein [Porticoccus sp. W117]MDM3872551.1 hypothetical protein [Porticoccus sp. W117]